MRGIWILCGTSRAIVVYILLILSPALLQRYNRLRVYPVIRRLEARQRHFKHEPAG
jgi:hypothetical protein